MVLCLTKGYWFHVPKVPMVRTPSFILPRDAGEERGGGFEQLERFERGLD